MPADRKWSSELRQEIVRRYASAELVSSISADTGVPVPTIYSILKTEGVAPSRMTRRKTHPSTPEEQAATMEWFMHKLFELEAETVRLRDLLADYSIDPTTGEVMEEA